MISRAYSAADLTLEAAEDPQSVPPVQDIPEPDPTATSVWQDEFEELARDEQAVVVVAVLCLLGLSGLLLTAVYSIVRYGWRSWRERQALGRVFGTADPDSLALAIEALNMLPLKQIATIRLRHLRFIQTAEQFQEQIKHLAFDVNTLMLGALPRVQSSVSDSDREMTLFEVLAMLEQIKCKGDLLSLEMMPVVLPARWKRYLDDSKWLANHDACLQQLQKKISLVQQISAQISDILVDRLQAGEPLAKPTFMRLVAALRQESPEERMSSSMSMSSSGTLEVKDEFSFMIKAFEELNLQHDVKQGLHEAIDKCNAHAESHAVITNGETTTTTISSRSRSSSNDSIWTHKLETIVDRAELLEVTHMKEVETAQYMLEEAKRNTFCSTLTHDDSKAMENMEMLTRTFVSMGADRNHAVLKAGEVFANRSNTMFLVKSLRGMFDELRKRDLMKMNERRKRDARKQQEKNDRLTQKFRNKQRLVTEKIDLQRQAQRQAEQEARDRRQQEELEALLKQDRAKQRQFVWTVTKIDVFVVIIVMGIVFFDSIRQIEILKAVCKPDDVKIGGMFGSWWPAAGSLALAGCQVVYGLKVLLMFLVVMAIVFLVSQLNIVAVVLPVAMATALYYLRAEWMNMLFRLPLLVVIYGFNLLCSNLLNPSSSTTDKSSHVGAVLSRRRSFLLYTAFPLVSLALSVLVGIGIACDDPHRCANAGFNGLSHIAQTVASMARDAYRL